NEPMEPNTMQQKPRPFSNTFFNVRELATSIIQGLVITAAVLAMYQYGHYATGAQDTTRAIVFTTLVSANVFLTLVNRSFYHSVISSVGYKNPPRFVSLAITTLITISLLLVRSCRAYSGYGILSGTQILRGGVVGAVSALM